MDTAKLLSLCAEIVVSSGIIWGATLALKRVLRGQLSARGHLLIWSVLIARLVVPVPLEIGLHLVPAPEAADAAAYSLQERIGQSNITYAKSAAADGSVPTASAADTGHPAAPGPGAVPGSEPAAAADISPSGRYTPWELSSADLTAWVWATGVLLSAALSLGSYMRLRLDIRARLVPGAEPLHKLFQDCLHETGVQKRVVLAVQNKLAGPALMYPNIVLVPDNLHEMRDETARMALRHELTHFRRRDHLKALGLHVLRIIWWFNPFVWLAVRSIREDIETACDADVVRPLGSNGKRAYARAILSMFGQTETSQAVLGMAFGGARKNVERRIRGVFMRRKSSMCGRTAAICLAGILSVACLTTACQPTPEREAVVNQKEGVPEQALIGQSETANPDASAAPQAQYVAEEHWTETIDKGDNFTVDADVDIMVPDVSAYPVEKLRAGDIPQEMADRLIDRFAPDAAFYQKSTRAGTRQSLERQIESEQEILADQKTAGDTREAARTEARIAALREAALDAPDASERVAASTEFTYGLDADGSPREETGAIYIDISAETPDGGVSNISVRRADPDNPLRAPYFIFEGPYSAFVTLQQDLSSLENLAQDKESAELLEEPYRSDQLDWLNEREASAQEHLAAYDRLDLDLDAARAAGTALLEELGISGMQITVCEKAFLGPAELRGLEMESAGSTDFTVPGVYMEFCREVGGIPCITPQDQDMDLSSSAAMYSAPFRPEHGTIVMDDAWHVAAFTWENPTEPVEIVAPDSQLISLSEAKERLTEELYRREYPENYAYIFEIDDVDLVMGYIDARDEPDCAIAVPAWYMRAQGTVSAAESAPYKKTQEVMLNALDGSPILVPGSLQNYGIE